MRQALLIAMTLLCAAPSATAEVFGRSADGTPLEAIRGGDIGAPTTMLVVGEIHGNEPAGRAVVRSLRATPPPGGVQLWTIVTVNPDGHRARTRQNGRGVDLNRNFRADWLAGGTPWETFYPGPSVFSEPESRAVRALVRRIGPDITVWYHQHMNLVVDPGPPGRWLARQYATVARMRVRDIGRLHGTAVAWQNTRFDDSRAFVVELPAGPMSSAWVRRHVRAVRRVAALRSANP